MSIIPMKGKNLFLICVLSLLGLFFLGSLVGLYIFYGKYIDCNNKETLACNKEEGNTTGETVKEASTEEKEYIFKQELSMKSILVDFQQANQDYLPFHLYYFPNAEVTSASYDVSKSGGGIDFGLIVEGKNIGFSENTYGIGGFCEGECVSYDLPNDTLGLKINVEINNGGCTALFTSEIDNGGNANHILTFEDDNICNDKALVQSLISQLELL